MNRDNFDFKLFILLPLAFSAKQKIDLGIKLLLSFPQHKSDVILYANLPEYRTITEQNNTFKSKLVL